MKPFKQLRFDQVAELPRVPHDWFSARVETVKVRSHHFGEVSIRVRIHGSGPPLLMVHGFMTTGYSFRYAMKPFGEHFTTFMPDLVGCGESDKPDVTYGPDEVADFLGELMAALGLRGERVLANSMGGYLAMRLAMRDPKAMSKLVNLHSPGLATARMHVLRLALDVSPRWQDLLHRVIGRNPFRWVHRNVHYFDETLKSREEHRVYGTPLATREGRAAFFRYLDETMSVEPMKRFEERLRSMGRFPIPLALVYARRDPMVPPSVGTRLAKLLPDARFIWLDQASHFAHVDAVDGFAGAAIPFLLSSD